MLIPCFDKEPWPIRRAEAMLGYGNISNEVKFKRQKIYIDIPTDLFPYCRRILRVKNTEPYFFEILEEDKLFYFLLTGANISHVLWAYKTLPQWTKL